MILVPFRAVPLVLAGLALLVACGDDGGTEPDPDPDPPAVEAVEVMPGSATLTEVGATHQFSAEATAAGGSAVDDVAFVWQSSDPTVATVDTTGLTTARGSGAAIITATARGVPGNATVTVNQAVAGLGFRTEPTSVGAGEAISPAVQVEVRDSAGAVVRDVDAPITLQLADTSGGARLLGTTTVHAVDGVATFSGLTVERAGADRALVATSPGIPEASSDSFAVTPADAVRLAFLVPPADTTTAGESLDVEFAVKDEFGNRVTSAADTVAIALYENPAGGALVGTTAAAPVDGVARFDAVTIERAGAGYALVASAQAFDSIFGPAFTIRPAPPDHLGAVALGGRPVGRVERPIEPAFEFAVHDAFENVVDTSTAAVSLTVAAGSGYPGAELGGRLSVDAVDGIATFDSVTIDKPGDYEVTASAPGIADTVRTVIGALVPWSGRVEAGTRHGCTVTLQGPFCWGSNTAGQLGDPATGPVGDSVATAADSDLRTDVLAGGTSHTCAIAVDDRIYCWGSGADGRLGTAGTADESSPTPVAATTTAPTSYYWLSAGDRHTCATGADSLAYCWGDNDQGQLGIGTTGTGVDTLTQVTDSLTFTWIASGGGHTCAIGATDSLAYCWGDNASGQLGDGNMGTDSPSPVPVSGSTKYLYIEAGDAHTCAVVASNADVECWGANDRGQLGNGNLPTNSDIPVSVGGVTVATFSLGGNEFATGRLGVGAAHTCAVTTNPSPIDCWGANDYGQLGNGTMGGQSADPVAADLTAISDVDPQPPLAWQWITAGAGQTCAFEFDENDAGGLLYPGVSGLYCWGRNADGQLGDGTTTDRDTPVRLIQGY